MCRPFPKLCGLVLFLLALLPLPPARAAEGRIPVFLPGTIIAANGRYIVTRNLSGPGPVISITALNVDLDINGMVLSETAGAGPVIDIPGPADHVVIHNGVLSKGTNGINATGAAASIIQKLDLEDLKIQDSAVDGIHLEFVEGAAIRRCEITDASSQAIDWALVGVTKHGTIEHNLIRRGADGIVIAGCSSVAVLNNRLEEPGASPAGGGFGIVLSACLGSLVAENTIESCRTEGIFLGNGSDGNKLFDNVVRDCNAHGIHLDRTSDENLLLHNVSTSNGAAGAFAAGILVESTLNKIDGNLMSSNAGVGLHFCAPFACGNSLQGNTARNNGGVLGPCGCGALGPGVAPDGCNNAAGCAAPTANLSAGHNVMLGALF